LGVSLSCSIERFTGLLHFQAYPINLINDSKHLGFHQCPIHLDFPKYLQVTESRIRHCVGPDELQDIARQSGWGTSSVIDSIAPDRYGDALWRNVSKFGDERVRAPEVVQFGHRSTHHMSPLTVS
jgi:hypothetical protein